MDTVVVVGEQFGADGDAELDSLAVEYNLGLCFMFSSVCVCVCKLYAHPGLTLSLSVSVFQFHLYYMIICN